MSRPIRLVVLVALLAIRPPASTAATFTVDSGVDDVDGNPGDGVCATSGGACTLRAAIQEASSPLESPDTIVVPAGNYVLTIPGAFENDGASGDLDVRDQIEIVGAGADATIVDGNGLDTVLHVLPEGSLTIRGMTVRNGHFGGIYNQGNLVVIDSVVRDSVADLGAGVGNDYEAAAVIINSTVTANVAATACGGIWNYYEATLTLIDSTVSDNQALGTGGGGGMCSYPDSTLTLERSTMSGNSSAHDGGGISFFGELATISNSTISGNRAARDGGGIFRFASFEEGETYMPVGPVRLHNSTVAGNEADSDGDGIGDGGGIASPAPGFTVRNTIVADNADAGGEAPDCEAPVVSEGRNLIENASGCPLSGLGVTFTGVSAELGPLADNGGPTQTHALLAGSPAIDAGDPEVPGSGGESCTTRDQRDVIRPQPPACDIGAYEFDVGLCTAVMAGCKAASARRSLLRLDRRTGHLLWKWRGAATANVEFGSPTTTTDYVMCLFDLVAGVPEAVLRGIVPGGPCAPQACWTNRETGFGYKNRAATPTGIGALKLKAGTDGVAAILARGQGATLGLPTLPLAKDPTVILQLQRSDGSECWEATYSTSTSNSDTTFAAKSD